MADVKRTPVIVVGALALVLAIASPAFAGGWAVTSLDEVPVPEPGEEVVIGFTVRQHGVSPVDVDEGDVGIEITGPSGSAEFFEATREGPTGHYVARVVFPETGEYSWVVRQGWFGDQELGTIDVAPPVASEPPVTSSAYRWPAWLRYGLPALAALLGALAIADLVLSWRRRRERPGLVAG